MYIANPNYNRGLYKTQIVPLMCTQTNPNLGLCIHLIMIPKPNLFLYILQIQSLTLVCTKLKLNSVALVRERTIPTERPPLVGEVVPTFAGRGVSRGQRNESPRPFSVF